MEIAGADSFPVGVAGVRQRNFHNDKVSLGTDMNAIVERSSVTLQDRYKIKEGWAYMTGMQALVRLPLQQRARDAALGWFRSLRRRAAPC